MTMLRHLYGLPYSTDLAGRHNCSLLAHALVYVATEKYQVKKLQAEASMAMKNIVSDNGQEASVMVESMDLPEALCVMIAGTPTGDICGREVLLAAWLAAILVRTVEGVLSEALGHYWLLALGLQFVLTVVCLPRGLFGWLLRLPPPARLTR